MDLETFLGMAVYFASYIPYFSWIAAPLFSLLRKGNPWSWTTEHDEAFEALKQALVTAPVRGHPMRGQGYQLYTDASDVALAGALQQIQPVVIRDLQGTKVYERLKKAWDKDEPIPDLVTKLTGTSDDRAPSGPWAEIFEDTVVQVEQVITYWSRTCKTAEK